jgi:regulator of replication initiation timing
MSYYKDQDLRPEVRERNVRDAYKRLHKLEAENSILQDQIKKLMDQSLTIGAENKKLREENGKLEVWNEDATQLYIKLTKTLDKVAEHRSVIRKKLHIVTEALEFYADEGNSGIFDPLQAYQSNLDIDSGSIARKALKEIE